MAVSAIIAAVATLAIPRVQDSIEKAKVARAIGDIRSIASDLDAQDSLPDNLGGIGRAGLLDPWGRAYSYLKFEQGKCVPPGARRDRFLVPNNSAYDL